MDILTDTLMVLHLAGMAILLGGFVFTLQQNKGSKTITPTKGMLHAAILMLITGASIYAIAEIQNWGISHTFAGIKIALATLIFLYLLKYRTKNMPKTQFLILGSIITATLIFAVVAN